MMKLRRKYNKREPLKLSEHDTAMLVGLDYMNTHIVEIDWHMESWSFYRTDLSKKTLLKLLQEYANKTKYWIHAGSNEEFEYKKSFTAFVKRHYRKDTYSTVTFEKIVPKFRLSEDDLKTSLQEVYKPSKKKWKIMKVRNRKFNEEV